MSSDNNVVHLDNFRKPVDLDEPMTASEQDIFSMDTVADQWANELVFGLMKEFGARSEDVDLSDPVYSPLMNAMADVVRSMTRHHLGVVDETVLMLRKYPDAVVSVGVMTLDEEGVDV